MIVEQYLVIIVAITVMDFFFRFYISQQLTICGAETPPNPAKLKSELLATMGRAMFRVATSVMEEDSQYKRQSLYTPPPGRESKRSKSEESVRQRKPGR